MCSLHPLQDKQQLYEVSAYGSERELLHRGLRQRLSVIIDVQNSHVVITFFRSCPMYGQSAIQQKKSLFRATCKPDRSGPRKIGNTSGLRLPLLKDYYGLKVPREAEEEDL